MRKTEVTRKPTAFDLERGLQLLKITGRDGFYTHLLMQEIPFWLQTIYAQRTIDKEEILILVKRRGFNRSEAAKLRTIVKWLNENAKRIRATRPVASKRVAFLDGWAQGSKLDASRLCPFTDPAYKAGYCAAKRALRAAVKAYVTKET